MIKMMNFEEYHPLNTEDIEYVDQLVEDYLLFRGFLNTRKTFIREKEDDKNKGFQACKIVQQLFFHIHAHDLDGLIELWGHLQSTFFSRLDEDLARTVTKLELSLKRYYVIWTIQTGHKEKCLQFFEMLGDDLGSSRSWRSWFVLPFLKTPATDSTFKVFFTKSWADTLSLSLTNFLSAIFNSMELPKILNFNAERKVRINMQRDLDHLKTENQKLREKVDMLRQQLEYQKNQIKGTSPTTNNSQKPAPTGNVQDTTTKTNNSSPFMGPEGGVTSVSRKLRVETDNKALIIKHQNLFTENSPVNCVRFSPHGSAIAAGTEGGVVRIWPLDSVSSTDTAIYGNSPITCIDWVRPWAGDMLLCGSTEGKVKLWNTATQEALGEVVMSPSYKKVMNICCSPSPGSIFTVSSAGDNFRLGGALTMWDMNNFQSLNRMKFDPPTVISSLSFNQNGSLLAAAGLDGFIRLFDLSTLKQIAKWKAHRNGVSSVQFSPDETFIYSVGGKDKIKLWSAHAMGQVIKTYNYTGTQKGANMGDIAVSHDGKYFLVSSRENFGLLYHIDQNKPLQNIGYHTKPVVSVDWNPLQNSVVTASLDNTVCMVHFKYPDR